MQVVINISHNLYESIIKDYALSELGRHELYKAIQKGNPLPEHNGKLLVLDEDMIREHSRPLDCSCCGWLVATIPAAEMEESECGWLDCKYNDGVKCLNESTKLGASCYEPATEGKELSCNTCKHKNKKYQEFPCIDCLEKDRYEEGE